MENHQCLHFVCKRAVQKQRLVRPPPWHRKQVAKTVLSGPHISPSWASKTRQKHIKITVFALGTRGQVQCDTWLLWTTAGKSRTLIITTNNVQEQLLSINYICADIFSARTSDNSSSHRGQTRTNADKSRTKQKRLRQRGSSSALPGFELAATPRLLSLATTLQAKKTADAINLKCAKLHA